MQLDAARPFLTARASTTKNRKEAVIPLHPSLAKELQAAKGKLTDEAARVFKLGKNISRSFGQDLQRAGITALDALGRKLDFHALRKTFATRLAGSGVPQRLTQELMRHQDANLTAQTYTDASLLPTFDAVASLKWEGDKPAPYTHIDTQDLGPDGQNGAHGGTGKPAVEVKKTLENKGQSHALAGPVPDN